ncbi:MULTISPECIES: hypothetical protein [Pseudanabaena]|nr:MULTISPECIES: hypothetical protein [Pseudanabaena]MEA5489117.1 hypothetical protein [Pseudanabaena sp. CCNP1317]WGS71718.1 hypothetical protein OA858_18730 [Pseudanabaena galeata CCNP1313]
MIFLFLSIDIYLIQQQIKSKIETIVTESRLELSAHNTNGNGNSDRHQR